MNYFLSSSSYNPSLIQNTLFELKLLSQGSNEHDHLSKNVKKFGLMNQLKNQQFMTCYSSLQFILFKMSINILVKWKISNKIVFYNKQSFSQFGAHFNSRPKIITYCQVFQKIIFGTTPFYQKIKVSEVQSKCFIF